MFENQDKVTLVIGATSEIGTAIAKHLASLQKKLFVTGMTKKKLDELLLSIGGLKQQGFLVDYNNMNSHESIFKSYEANIEGIVLITPRPCSNPSSAPCSKEWESLFRLGFIGPIEVLRQALPSLSYGGKIVILSGITSVQYYPALPQFAVLRNTWLAQAKAMATELGSKRVSVNTISLGGVWTKRLLDKMEKEVQSTQKSLCQLRKERVSNVPLQKYAEKKEIAQVIEHMLNDFSSHITGQNIVMDGGFAQNY